MPSYHQPFQQFSSFLNFPEMFRQSWTKNRHAKLRSDRNKIVRTLYETMALIKMFPTNDDYVKVCKSLILKYPFLKDKEGNGYHTWHMSLKRKFKYERVPLVDDEEVRRMKLKFGHHIKPLQQEENTSK